MMFGGWGNASEEHSTFKEAFENDPICNGFIKWDGCMELKDLNWHFCVYSNFLQNIIKMIYIGAKELMGERFDCDLANFK